MTNEQLVNKFKNGKIAINCQTEDQAKDFIEWVYANGMSWWISSADKRTNYRVHKENTCYRGDTKGKMSYENKSYYEQNGYEVITYTDFFKDLPTKKNFIPQITEMLGIEIDEEFDVYYPSGEKTENSPYFFHNKGFLCKDYKNGIMCGDCYDCEVTLLKMLSGEYSFKKHQPILDKVEKRYLENVLRPFKNSVKCITKFKTILDSEYISIAFYYPSEDDMCFPIFDKGTMYKGMKIDKDYTLEEVGLFADE